MQHVATAILKAMQSIGYLQKDKEVGTGKNAYKGLSDVKATKSIREALIEAELIAIPSMCEPNTKVELVQEADYQGQGQMKNKWFIFCEVKMSFTFIHTPSGEAVTAFSIGHGIDNGDKSAGKAMTYAKKNALLNALLISSGLDADDIHSEDLPDMPAKPAKPMPKQSEQEAKATAYWKENIGKATLQQRMELDTWVQAQGIVEAAKHLHSLLNAKK